MIVITFPEKNKRRNFASMFSKTFGYALTAVTHIAAVGEEGKKVGLQELSERLGMPRPFLGKIMQDLVRHGIIDSSKGPNGGFYVNESTLDRSIIDILMITDGSLVFRHCALGLGRCGGSQTCLLHHDFAACRDTLLKAISSKTIRQLAKEIPGETGR